MKVKNPLLLWEAALTFLTGVAASLSLADIFPSKDVALFVIVTQSLNTATIVYKTGQWNPSPEVVPPAVVHVVKADNDESA